MDEAIDALPAADRHLLLLRFFERKSFAEIGAAFGKSENAVQKQCDRALERLRRRLRRQGVAIPVAVLASGLSTGMIQVVPASLAMTISQSAVAGASALSAKTIILQTFEIMAQAKTKAAVATCVAACIGIPLVYLLTSPEESAEPETIPESVQNGAPAQTPSADAGTFEIRRILQPPSPSPVVLPKPAENVEQAPPVDPPPHEPSSAEDWIAASPFRASSSAMLQPGEVLITGGWATAPGMRTFVFVTQTVVEATDDRPLMISVSPVFVEATEEVWRSFGFDTIMAHGPDSTVKETLSSGLAVQLRHTFKEIIPEIIKPGRRIIAWPDQQNRFTLTEDYESFDTIQITPSTPGTDGAVVLEIQLGIGHGPPLSLTGINRGVVYGY